MSFVVVIPARFASTRLPGKPLLDIAGKPMIQHVWERAKESGASEVIVATDDAHIAAVVRDFGGDVAITRVDHPSGTDRLQEVAQQRGWLDAQAVVNVQGDEPLIPPVAINQLAELLLAHQGADIATLCEAFADEQEFRDANTVKVVCNEKWEALYFSRALIASPRDGGFAAVPAYRHIGIYAYQAGFLNRYVSWPPCALEQAEKLEQLRALHKGCVIQVAPACAVIPAGVDTEQDLAQARCRLEKKSGFL